MHVPKAAARQFKETISGWFPEPGELNIKPANHNERWTPEGKIRTALGYVTKQCSQQAKYGTPYSRRRGDPVLGKRYRISRALLSASKKTVTVPSAAISIAAPASQHLEAIA
jgi:hypothetical protein